MTDKKISTNDLGATAGWLAGLVLIVVSILTDWETGDLGLLLAGAGATLNVRHMLMGSDDRERNAFDLGRDLGRSEGSDVSQIR